MFIRCIGQDHSGCAIAWQGLSKWEKVASVIIALTAVMAIISGIFYSQSPAAQGLLFGGIALDLSLVALMIVSKRARKVAQVNTLAEVDQQTAAALSTHTFKAELAKANRTPSLASEILPGVFLGSERGFWALLPEREYLLNECSEIQKLNQIPGKITLIRFSSRACQPPERFGPYLYVQSGDAPESWPSLAAQLDTIYDTIEKARTENRPVFLHCGAGISRSVTAVIYYLMKKYKCTLNQAAGFVQTKRPHILPNFAFRWHLHRYEETGHLPQQLEQEWEASADAYGKKGQDPLFDPDSVMRYDHNGRAMVKAYDASHPS